MITIDTKSGEWGKTGRPHEGHLKKGRSKAVAYILLILFGYLGAHKFYLGKVGMGILYILTGGLFSIGIIVDLFILWRQVDKYNQGVIE